MEGKSRVWHGIDEVPKFNENNVTPLIVDAYYGHIGGVAQLYTGVSWKNHVETHRNREFTWAYESDLFN